MFSARVPGLRSNRVARALAARRASGQPIDDLTCSNPTGVGLPYPNGLLDALASPAALRYDPAPFGAAVAREAVASYLVGRGVTVAPERVILTASTSEAYTLLFKLLCDPADLVLVPQPSSRLLQNGPSSRPAATPRLTLPRRPATRAWSSDAPWSGPRGTLPHSIQCRAGTRRRPRWGAGAETPPQPSAVSGAVSMGQSRRAVIGTVLPRATRGTDRRACHPHRSSREARAQRACVGGRSWGEAAATARRARPLVPQAGT